MSDEVGGFTERRVPGRDDERAEPRRAEVAEALRPELEIIRTLGQGSTAHVFLAREPALKRLVAVKVLRPDVGESETARARFEREAHCEARITDSSVLTIHRVGRLESGIPYLVQEYLEGRTLRDILESSGTPLPPAEARRILTHLAGALAAAHASGVIHRDVRPENVMLEEGGDRVVLMDFGIAAVRESGDASASRLTRTGEVLGDWHYSSPEQAQGQPVTAETDVYSLGVLGYELLTLSTPFGPVARHELVEGHLTGRPTDLPPEVRSADPDLAEVLERCMAKEPLHRPRAEDVRRFLAGEGGGLTAPASTAGATSSYLAPFPRLAAFVSELRRRRVYRFAVAYAVVGFATLEAAGLVLDALSAPAWMITVLVVIVLGGFPVSMALAWAFDLTAEGIRRTRDVDASTASTALRVYKAMGLVASVLFAAVLGWLVLG